MKAFKRKLSRNSGKAQRKAEKAAERRRASLEKTERLVLEIKHFCAWAKVHPRATVKLDNGLCLNAELVAHHLQNRTLPRFMEYQAISQMYHSTLFDRVFKPKKQQR